MILKNQRIFIGPREVTLDLGAVSIESGVEAQDNTVFQANTRTNEGGLFTAGWSIEGFWKAGTDEIDPRLFSNLGISNVPLTVLAQGSAAADRAFFFPTLESEYHFLGTVGDENRFTAGGQASARLVRGQVLFYGTATSTANGSSVQVGAAGTGTIVYAALHVVAASGTSPTLAVVVQSDDATGFPSATSRITFATATAKTSEFKTLAGPITDNWWRIVSTIGGTTPSFTFAVVLGIH